MKKVLTLTFVAIFILAFLKQKNSTDLFYEKILNTSAIFLNKPYSLGPLGEKKGIDTDPLYREDKFDCLTYVETVLANVYNNDEDIVPMMNKIRYKNGIVSFETRNHFQNPDWVVNNAQFIKNKSDDISRIVLNNPAKKSTINLNRKKWFKQNYNIDIDTNIEVVKLDYISLSDFENNIERFKSFINKPYIFMTVIKDDSLKEKIGTEIDISHTGFLINKNDNLYIRHASSTAGKVVDNDFYEYIEKLKKNSKYQGFSLLEIQDLKSVR